MNEHELANQFKRLVGRKIAEIRYMTKEEADDVGWTKRPLCIIFTDGSYLFASKDDEGNDGGALFTSIVGLETIGTIR